MASIMWFHGSCDSTDGVGDRLSGTFAQAPLFRLGWIHGRRPHTRQVQSRIIRGTRSGVDRRVFVLYAGRIGAALIPLAAAQTARALRATAAISDLAGFRSAALVNRLTWSVTQTRNIGCRAFFIRSMMRLGASSR
jgi:hypothetical protein